MIWHVVFAEAGELPQSRAARSRDTAVQMACELLGQAFDVRRIIAPDGAFIERTEFDELYDGGRSPGLGQTPQSPGTANGVGFFREFSLQGLRNSWAALAPASGMDELQSD